MAGGVCCDALSSDWSGTLHCPFPFLLSVPLVSFPFPFCLVLSCLLWVGKCDGGGDCVLLSPSVFVFVVSALLVGVVSLWNGGVCVSVCGLVACLPLLLCVGVRGSARAALRART